MTTSCGHARRVCWPETGPQLASAEVVEARQHTDSCVACQCFMRDMAALAALAARSASTPQERAPDDFRERLFAAAAAASRGERAPWRWQRVIGPIVAAAVLVVAGIVGMTVRYEGTSRSPADPLTLLATEHQESLGESPLVSSDMAEVARWLERRVDFPVFIPELPQARLRGARVSMLDGRRGAVLRYDVTGVTMSYFIMPLSPESVRRDEPVVFVHASVGGVHIVTWHEDGLLHAMVGTSSATRLEQLARHCVDQMKLMVAPG